MKVLITGATGFIGQHLLDELKDDPFSVRIISRKQKPEFWCANKNFEIVQGDITNKTSLEKAFEGIDVVINLAAELQDTSKLEATNITGIKNLVELADKNNVKKIIHLSSVGVVGMQYSRNKIIVDESSPCHPQNEYERTKLQSETLLNEFGKKSKTEINIIRPTNVFGDHHPRKALLGFFQRIKSGKSFPAASNAIVNYVYVKDVAHALRFCLLNDIGNKTFSIGKSLPLQDFLKLSADQLKSKSNIVYLPSFLFRLMNLLGYLGIEKLKANLRGISNCVEYQDAFMKNKIQYKYGTEKGIANTIKDYFG